MDGEFICTAELKIVISLAITNPQICEAAIYFRGTSRLISVIK